MTRPLLLVLACSAALSASGGAGYLALIGPAPLRFEGRARPVPRALAMLPPLLLQDPQPTAPPTNAVEQVTIPDPAPAVVMAPPPALTNFVAAPPLSATNLPVVLFSGPLPPPTGPLLGPLFDPNDPNSLLTAQMLIHYFRPSGTNAPGVSVFTPLFVPPPPATPPSSTVRYTTP